MQRLRKPLLFQLRHTPKRRNPRCLAAPGVSVGRCLIDVLPCVTPGGGRVGDLVILYPCHADTHPSLLGGVLGPGGGGKDVHDGRVPR